MGCPKLPYQNFSFLEIVHPEKSACGEKKRINYYPFGLKHKGYNNVINGTDHPYGFGGKEEQNELGLAWIDITARNYDPAIGRWMNIDPLAEDMRRHSPYNYAFNNPIYFIDPDGMEPFGIGGLIDNDNFDRDIKGNRISPLEPWQQKGKGGIFDELGIESNFIGYASGGEDNGEGNSSSGEGEGNCCGGRVSLSPNAGNSGLMASARRVLNGGEPNGSGESSSGLSWKTPVGGGLVLLGANIISTRGKLGGATLRTSILSKYLSSTKWGSRPTPKWLFKITPKRVFGMPLRSPVLGRLIARAAPGVGWGLLLYDVIDMTYPGGFKAASEAATEEDEMLMERKGFNYFSKILP